MMKHTNILKDFLRYVSLNILGQMAYSCYTMADTFFVSAKLGSVGLTALNLAFPIFCLMNGIGLMIGMGAGTRYSIAKSRGEKELGNKIFTNAFYMVVAFASLFFLAGILFSGTLIRLLGADDSMFALTNTYLQVMLLFAPAFFLNNLLQCFVRNDGCPGLSMAAIISGSLSNVILDYVFIFPLDMGILGSILATGLAPVISLLVLSPYFFRRKNNFHLRSLAPDRRNILDISASGVPPFVTEAASGVVMFLFNFLLLRLEGNIGVAAFGILSVISLVVAAIYTGLSQGIQPVLSLNHGTGNIKNVKKVRSYALVTALLISVFLYSIIFFYAPELTLIFNSEKDPVLQAFAVPGLRLYFLACPFLGFNLVTATYFTSTERPRPAQLLSFLRGFLILIPMAFLLSSLFKITGVWCAYPMTEAMVAVIGVILSIRLRSGKSR